MRCSGCIRSGCKTAIEDLGKLNIEPCCRVWKEHAPLTLVPVQPRGSSALRPRPSAVKEKPTLEIVPVSASGSPASSSQQLRPRPHSPSHSHSHGKPALKVVVSDEVDTCSTSSSSSFYMRSLPSQLIGFSTLKGQRLLMDCANESECIPYFPLIEQFVTQETPPSCGAATIAMILNSLRIDPQVVWEHPWRWYNEKVLESCDHKKFQGSQDGISMEEFAYTAECNGLHSSVFYADDAISLQVFRQVLRRYVGKPDADNASADARVVTCFSRKHLGQTGTGHYSPIGAYHEGKDMCLILDVARFKYPPFWVSVTQLWEAMRATEKISGRPRGFFVLQKAHECDESCSGITPPMVMPNVQDAMEELTTQRHSHCVARTYSHRLRRSLIHEPKKFDALFDFVRNTPVYNQISENNPQDCLWRPHSSLRKELWSLFLIALSERHLPEAIRKIKDDIVAANELLSLSTLCAGESIGVMMCGNRGSNTRRSRYG